jgi:HlyD family secretion protein
MPPSLPRRLRSVVVVVLGACTTAESAEPLRTATVEVKDIIIAATAAGTVAPVTTIEVKSQASGEIVEVNVEDGDHVDSGELLLRVDPRIQANAVAQAVADSVVAAAALENADSRLRRSQALHDEKAITDEEFEAARFDHANAYANLMRAQRALEDARIAQVQTEVRAPASGIILSRTVEVGTVIASASRDVGGGTVLMRMASLDIVEVQALVDERDIGRIASGLPVEISVSAYPERTFRGSVLRIGAEAILEQNVTTFPVIVRIPNAEGLLKPGMNAEARILIGEANDAVAVPNVALRDPHDLEGIAELLQVDADSLAAIGSAMPDGAQAVFVMQNGVPTLREVSVGLTDFDNSVVLDGLSAGDTVVILPTSGQLREEARRAEWAQRRSGSPIGGR